MLLLPALLVMHKIIAGSMAENQDSNALQSTYFALYATKGPTDFLLLLGMQSGSGPFNNSTDAGGVVQAVVPQVGCSEAPKIPGTIFYSVASRSIFNYDWQNFVQYVQYRTVDQGRQYIQRVTANQQPAQQVACDAATDSICIGK
jgi:hypothetical protein